MKEPTPTTAKLIEWLDEMLDCEDGTSGEFFFNLSRVRNKLLASEKMAVALHDYCDNGLKTKMAIEALEAWEGK